VPKYMPISSEIQAVRNDLLSLILCSFSRLRSIFEFVRYISPISSLEDRAYCASSILRAKTSLYFSNSIFVFIFVDPSTIS